MKAVFKVVFDRRGRLKDVGWAPVEIYCYVEGKKKYIGTGIRLKEGEWDERRGRVSEQHLNHHKMNFMLSDAIRKLEEYEMKVIDDRGEFTYTDLKAYGEKGPVGDFIEFLHQEITQDNTISPSTRRYRLQMLEKLKTVTGQKAPFSIVRYEMIQRFDNHMANLGHMPSTIRKMHQQLRKFIAIGIRKGFIKENPYNLFRIKRVPRTLKKCLWHNDMEKLWELKYEDNLYQLALDKFLFSCCTGLRISDNNALKWDHIREGKIFMTMQKTRQPVVVPLNVLDERAAGIIEKYRGKGTGKVFPQISEQVVNRQLKRISIDASIPFSLHFHVSRHTFCTLVADRTGSVFDVMRYAGIYKIDTAMIYVNLAKMFSQ